MTDLPSRTDKKNTKFIWYFSYIKKAGLIRPGVGKHAVSEDFYYNLLYFLMQIYYLFLYEKSRAYFVAWATR